jgi:dihydrofolate reductase
MRKIIAALHVSLDGFVEGPEGELDWIRSWEDAFDLLDQIDTCILGRRMFPAYQRYWRAVLAEPDAALPQTGRPATPEEIEYARFAEDTPHVILSTTLDEVDWENSRIVRDVGEIRALKHEEGGDMHAVGGAALVSSLVNADLVDELRLVVQPIVLGGGTALFGGLDGRRNLRFRESWSMPTGAVRLTYDM